MYVCMYACMHACMHACMYVCMYACGCVGVRPRARAHVCCVRRDMLRRGEGGGEVDGEKRIYV